MVFKGKIKWIKIFVTINKNARTTIIVSYIPKTNKFTDEILKFLSFDMYYYAQAKYNAVTLCK